MKRLFSIFMLITLFVLPIGKVNAYDLAGLSKWAENDFARAVSLGFVPSELLGNWQGNIIRGEYARLALCFLAVQYGYTAVNSIQTNYVFKGRGASDPESTIKYFEWKAVEKFIADYCETKPDREGNPILFKNLNPNYNQDKPLFFSWWWDVISHVYKPFSDVDYKDDGPYINAAYLFGLVNGVGEGLYNPSAPITRQEAAVLLMRVYSNYGGVVPDKELKKFSDSDLIAGWAASAVQEVTAIGVMQGKDNETFDPLGYYTREQAIVTFMRLYENAPVSRKKANIPPLVDYQSQINNCLNNGFTVLEQYKTPSCTVLYGDNDPDPGVFDYCLYLIYHNGGFRDVTYFLRQNGAFINAEPIYDIQISKDGSRLSFKVYVTEDYNYFCYLGDLYNSNKVYENGGYCFLLDIETGKYLQIEKIS